MVQVSLFYGPTRIPKAPLLRRLLGAEFDGSTYDAEQDRERLRLQVERVFDTMADGRWRTLPEIEQATGAPQASISARLRDLRKERFGAYTVDRRRRNGGLWEYRLEGPR